MASKTATVMVRVEPELKEQAEHILNELGFSASAAINSFYRQIVRHKGFPYQVTLDMPTARDEMEKAAFDAMMEKGLEQAKAGQGYSVEEAFAILREELPLPAQKGA